MASFRPMGAWGLQVPPNDNPSPAVEMVGDPAETIHVTMAALDPTEKWEENQGVETGMKQRATLKMILIPGPDEDEEDDDDEDGNDPLADLLGDDDEDESEEEANGGPSDPDKSPKARKRDALMTALADGNKDDMDVDGVNGVNGVVEKKPKGKGKTKATELSDSASDESEGEESKILGAEEYVLCTLDPDQHYQQPLDVRISHRQTVLFTVTGSHSIHMTGNMENPIRSLLHPDSYDSEDEDDEMDLPPDEDELDIELPEDEDESDELDDIEDPRIQELSSEDENPPKLIKSQPDAKKAKNKRAAEDSAEDTPEKPTTDSILAKSLEPAEPNEQPKANGEQKLSKNQQKKMRKKMKDNAGKPIDVAAVKMENEDKGVKTEAVEATTTSPGKTDKKVSFAKTLVQGPSSGSSPNPEAAKEQLKTAIVEPQNKSGADETNKSSKPSLGTKTVQGVTIEDRKLGEGRLAKKGDKVSMRYIGKLQADKRVFDSNKKGAPFSFKIGSGEVIKGWDIGVAGMAIAGERRITIPPHLAYGSKGQGKDIPPNSTLVFDLKVLDIR